MQSCGRYVIIKTINAAGALRRPDKEDTMQPKYKRVLLKLSGEALAGPAGHGIDEEVIS